MNNSPSKKEKDKENNTDEIIKVNIFSNDNKKQKLNIDINENLLLDENNKIDTHVPIPESRPKELFQSPIKYNESEIASFTPSKNINNNNINSSRISNINSSYHINLNTNGSLFYSTGKKSFSNNMKYKIDSMFKSINNKKYDFDLYKNLKNNIIFKSK